MTTILLAAAEPSGDAMGAALMVALRARVPDARLIGCGGAAMAGQGLRSAFDTAPLAVMGLGDALRAVPAALGGARRLAGLARAERADAAVLIDAWGFSRLAGAGIARASPETALVKLAAPQVWASRPGRAEAVRDRFDLVLTLLPFEPDLFRGLGTRAVFVGNPNFRAAADAPRDGAAFRARHGLGDAPVLVVLPGSRAGEVARLAPVFAEAARRTLARVPGCRAVIVAAPAVEDAVRRAVWPDGTVTVPAGDRFDAFDAADAALAKSGTVTTELAVRGVPMTVAYRTGALTAAWARRAVIAPYVSILNVAANAPVVPERLQEDCAPDVLTDDLVRLLTDANAREAQRAAFARHVPALVGEGDAAGRAADEIVALVRERERPRHLDAGA